MSKLVEAIKAADIPPGNMRSIKLEGRDILLANISGDYHAISNKCPHMGGNLSKGKLEGAIVTCPLHGSQFDVTTGKVVRWLKGSGVLSSIGKALKHPQDIVKYPVAVKNGSILVDI